jgi:hypothetical protein
MAQLKKVVDPFGEVNIHPTAGGRTRVTATILMEPHKEGAQTGIALDGSGSMAKLYGKDDGGGVLSPIFRKAQPRNEVTPVAQQICAYLARRIDADGGTTVIYWSTGENGGQIEVVGDLRAEQAEDHVFGPPRDFGTGTQLLPAVKYFVERFKDAPWGFYVFITDGELHDLDAVKQYSTWLAKEVATGRRRPLKFVLIGLGPDANEGQMEELDDLETGTPIDLWDHKLAKEMRVLQEIFAEVVDKNARVADNGRILDPQGRVLKNYGDTGLPAYLEFEVPVGTPFFTLEVNGQRIHQGLSDQASVPLSGAAAPVAAPPVARPAPPPIPAASPAPPAPAAGPKAPPTPPARVAEEEYHEAMDVAHGKADTREENADDETWRMIDFGDAGDKPESGPGGKK